MTILVVLYTTAVLATKYYSGGKKLRTSVFQTLPEKKKKMVSLLYGGTVKFSSKLLHGYYRGPVSLSLSHELEIKGFIGNILTPLAFVAEM